MVAVQAAALGGSDGGIDPDLVSLFCDLADTAGMSVGEVLAAIGDRGGLAFFPHPGRYHEEGSWYVEHLLAHPRLLGVEVVATGPTLQYREVDGRASYVRARLPVGDSETGSSRSCWGEPVSIGYVFSSFL